MDRSDIQLMLGVGFTFLELLARIRAKNPNVFESEAEALQKMIDKANDLKAKPVHHVQQWSRDQE